MPAIASQPPPLSRLLPQYSLLPPWKITGSAPVSHLKNADSSLYALMVGRYALLTNSMVGEVVKVFDHDLFENIQVSNQNVGPLTNIKPAFYTQMNDIPIKHKI